MHRYRAWGLTIDSELDIPGAVIIDSANTLPPDLQVDYGSAQLAQSETVVGPYARRGDAVLFTAPKVASYLGSRDGTLTVATAAGATEKDVCELLIATALPMMIWMRGEFVLHAAGVVLPGNDGVIAIAGPSGSGKSTLINQLVGAGAQAVGDDTLRLVINERGTEVSGLPAGYFLPTSDGSNRRMQPVPAPQRREQVRLAAMVVIDLTRTGTLIGTGTGTAFDRCSATRALESVLNNRHRPRVPAILGQHKRVFEQSVLLCRQVPIYTFYHSSRPTQRQWQVFAASIPMLKDNSHE